MRKYTSKVATKILRGTKPKLGISTGRKKPMIGVALRGKPRKKSFKIKL